MEIVVREREGGWRREATPRRLFAHVGLQVALSQYTGAWEVQGASEKAPVGLHTGKLTFQRDPEGYSLLIILPKMFA